MYVHVNILCGTQWLAMCFVIDIGACVCVCGSSAPVKPRNRMESASHNSVDTSQDVDVGHPNISPAQCARRMHIVSVEGAHALISAKSRDFSTEHTQHCVACISLDRRMRPQAWWSRPRLRGKLCQVQATMTTTHKVNNNIRMYVMMVTYVFVQCVLLIRLSLLISISTTYRII